MSVLVTNSDLVMLGHGSYAGGAKNFKLPDNIMLYVLPPVGYTLRTDVAEAMIQQRQINQLSLHHDNGRGNTTIEPPSAIYEGGKLAPDLTLYDLGSLSDWGRGVIGQRTNVITVSQPTLLSQLIQSDGKINEALKRLSLDSKLKLYWSACASQVSGNSASL